MKKFLRYGLTLLVMGILFCGCFSVSASAEALTGDLGNGFTWELDTETRTLTIRGLGKLHEFRAYYPSEQYFLFEKLSSHFNEFDKVVLDEGITAVSKGLPWSLYMPETIVLGKDVKDSQNLTAVATKSYEVDPENPYFASYKGGLYTKDYSKLIAYPTNRTPVEFHPNTTSLGEYAFEAYGSYARIEPDFQSQTIIIPWGITKIEQNCFFEPWIPITVVLPDTAIHLGSWRIYAPHSRGYDLGSNFIFSKFNSIAAQKLYHTMGTIYAPHSSNPQESGHDISQYYGLTPNSLKTFRNGKTYYFDQNCKMAKGWKQASGNWYYFNDYGAAVVKIWLKSGNKWYFMQADGTMATNKWVQWYNKWYYVGSDGAMYANRWIKSSGKWYYLGSDGAMYTNRYTPDGYWVNANGVWA